MSNHIFDRLRDSRGESADSAPRPTSQYSFQGGSTTQNLGARPGMGTLTNPTRPADPARPAGGIRFERTPEGDRPAAYDPPAMRRREDEGDVYSWKPPGFADILADLGLRILEVGIAAAAYAVGEEIAYFFKKRRFTTGNKNLRD